jgi:hypothetical protein
MGNEIGDDGFDALIAGRESEEIGGGCNKDEQEREE